MKKLYNGVDTKYTSAHLVIYKSNIIKWAHQNQKTKKINKERQDKT